MTWRHVFDTTHRNWKDIHEARNFAQCAGYKFFAFNGIIYWSADYTDIGLRVPDIEGGR